MFTCVFIMSFKEIILAEIEMIRIGTENVLLTIPKDKLDFRPKNHMMPLGHLAYHVSTVLYQELFIFENKWVPSKDIKPLLSLIDQELGPSVDKSDFVAIFNLSVAFFTNYYKNLSEDEWINKTFSYVIQPEPQSYLQGLIGALSHLVQHRGALYSYLRMLETDINFMNYFGFQKPNIKS